jgi:hypothetical protein
MRFRTIITAGLTLAIAGGAAATTAGAASAATHPAKPVEAITKIVNRADNGGGGQWANDSYTRTLDLYYLGKSTNTAMAATPFMYWAKVTDTGTFRNLPGQLAPNQGGKYAGVQMKAGQVSGPVAGAGQWGVFYASAKAERGLAPRMLKGNALNAQYPSATWPELAFPVGTTFSGVNESAYDYLYQAVPFTKYVVKTVHGQPVLDPKTHKPVLIKITGFKQTWRDASYNGDGQLRADGQILGVR